METSSGSATTQIHFMGLLWTLNTFIHASVLAYFYFSKLQCHKLLYLSVTCCTKPTGWSSAEVLQWTAYSVTQWVLDSSLRTLLLRIVNPRIMGTALHFTLSDSKSNNIKKTVCLLNGEKIVMSAVWSLHPALWTVWTYVSHELPYWNTFCCRKQILEALLALSGALRTFSFQEFVTSH